MLALAELDNATALKGFHRGQPESHPGATPPAADAVVGHLHHERAARPADTHGHASRMRVLVGVANGLGEHRLRQRLEPGRNVALAT